MRLPPPYLIVRALFTAVCLAGALPAVITAETIDLAGEWRYQLDRDNTGAANHWFTQLLPHNAPIKLPGSLPENGIGDPVVADTKWTGGIFDKSYFTAPEYAPYRQPGNIKVPFWLQPETHYVGAAWFQRDLEIPATWSGRPVQLSLERPHWKTTVWLDDREIGSNDALCVAHEYNLGTAVTPGRHRLTIRIDNTLTPDIGENSHSVSDHTQGNWNGLVGRMELTATASAWVDELQIYPKAKERAVVVRGRVASTDQHASPKKVRISGGLKNGPARPAQEASVARDGSFSLEYSLGKDAPLWDEFNPALHQITVALDNGEQRQALVGLREIAREGRRLTLNGRNNIPAWHARLCGLSPHRPSADRCRQLEQNFGVVRAHGLNHVRFHSWCPPEAAFVARR